MVATGALPADAQTSRAFAQFEPGRMVPGGAETRTIMPRFASLLLDRALQDPDWPLDLISSLRLLVSGGWSLPQLVQQAQIDPDLPAGLSRAWSRSAGTIPCFPGHGHRARSLPCVQPSSRPSWWNG
jgi:hypothetical protein